MFIYDVQTTKLLTRILTKAFIVVASQSCKFLALEIPTNTRFKYRSSEAVLGITLKNFYLDNFDFEKDFFVEYFLI